MSPQLFAHRYLANRRVEFICMKCLHVVCNVQRQEDADPFVDAHICEKSGVDTTPDKPSEA